MSPPLTFYKPVTKDPARPGSILRMKHSTKLLFSALSGVLLASHVSAADENPAAGATNALGLDLYRMYAAEGKNLCLSPYSIQSAFAMTTNGAAGKTLEEMRQVLHYPEELASLNEAFSTLSFFYAEQHRVAATQAKRGGGKQPALEIMVANRLFGQKGYPFTPAFLEVVDQNYHAPLQFADFKGNFDGERKAINEWVEGQTRDHIKDLLPDGSLDSMTRLVLVNALYFKASWRHQFNKSVTRPAPFHLASDNIIETPTMRTIARFGYAKEDGYTALSLPYTGGFSMLVLIPDDPDELGAIESGLTPGKLSTLARLDHRSVDLRLPKFKIEGGTIPLKSSLQKLGMKLAFDARKADFGRMTADKSLPGLYIDDAYHKTFIGVDEKGTEAAAATAVVMKARNGGSHNPGKPIIVRIDRPFFYAILDNSTNTALFLGRVTDPR